MIKYYIMHNKLGVLYDITDRGWHKFSPAKYPVDGILYDSFITAADQLGKMSEALATECIIRKVTLDE